MGGGSAWIGGLQRKNVAQEKYSKDCAQLIKIKDIAIGEKILKSG